ncbi:MAG: hypothetical protein RR960_06470, partial [Alistipes sp.]
PCKTGAKRAEKNEMNKFKTVSCRKTVQFYHAGARPVVHSSSMSCQNNTIWAFCRATYILHVILSDYWQKNPFGTTFVYVWNVANKHKTHNY